jgi:tRNA(fMet)-specific endonuclease VapC
MSRYLLDTNILIFAMRADPDPSLIERLEAESDQLAVSSVSVFELIYGAEKSSRPERNRRIARDLVKRTQILPFDYDTAFTAGAIRADLERAGTPIGPYDLQIAATARQHGLTVVTNNTREFVRVEGLIVEDWTR